MKLVGRGSPFLLFFFRKQAAIGRRNTETDRRFAEDSGRKMRISGHDVWSTAIERLGAGEDVA